MKKLNFTALDFEYVTVKGQGKHITQVGIVSVSDGNIIDRYESLVKPSCSKEEFKADWHALNATGITYEMVAQAPSFSELLPTIYEKLNGKVVIAHNAKSADIAALTNELERNNTPRHDSLWPSFQCICTKVLSGCSLEDLCAQCNITMHQHHNACCDAECTAKAYTKLCNQLSTEEIDYATFLYDCSYYIGGNNSKRTSYNQCNSIEPTEFDIDLDNIPWDNPDQYCGQNIVLTGFDTYTKNLYKYIFNHLGANIQSNICNSTTLLVTGWKPGPKKIQKANEIGIPIISHWDLASSDIEENEDTEQAYLSFQ